MVLSLTAHAVPLTHFVSTGGNGFEAFIFPELTDGTPSVQGGVFTLPKPVHAGYVVIVRNPAEDPGNISNWTSVVHFINAGSGQATTVQLLSAGPDDASYFPSLSTVLQSHNTFIPESQSGEFTTYTVKSRVYHFFNAAVVPESGSSWILLSCSLFVLAVFGTLNLRMQ